MRMRILLFALLVGLLRQVPIAAADDQHPTPALQVSYCELVGNPTAYSGKLVRVRAIYRYGFEVERLETPECCASRAEKVWVEFGELSRASKRQLKKAPKDAGLAIGTFIGRFETHGPYGHLGHPYKLTILEVEGIEHSAHPSPTKNPPWVPSNCEKTGVYLRLTSHQYDGFWLVAHPFRR